MPHVFRYLSISCSIERFRVIRWSFNAELMTSVIHRLQDLIFQYSTVTSARLERHQCKIRASPVQDSSVVCARFDLYQNKIRPKPKQDVTVTSARIRPSPKQDVTVTSARFDRYQSKMWLSPKQDVTVTSALAKYNCVTIQSFISSRRSQFLPCIIWWEGLASWCVPSW